MATADGVRLIEYNARFGDPEALNVLPILNTNFVHVCQAILEGSLDKLKIEFQKKATVCKYIVPEGYPDAPRKNEKIEIAVPKNVLDKAESEDSSLKMYYSSVDQKEDGIYTSSSRAVAFVGIADTLHEAEKIAEDACKNVKGPVFHRRDVGTDALIQKRVLQIRQLRDTRLK